MEDSAGSSGVRLDLVDARTLGAVCSTCHQKRTLRGPDLSALIDAINRFLAEHRECVPPAR